jgi:predicted house-cleaning noncanonical NTP pyrophosphatase (MazG superfamily)
MIRYNKLVRDRIPEIITSDGKTCATRVLSAVEFQVHLESKLAEELAEFQESKKIEELVDMVEIIQAIAETQGLEWSAFEAMRAAKRMDRGGFRERLFLEYVSNER